MDKFKWFLVLVFLSVWAWAALSPNYRDSWWLENLYIFALVPVVIIAGRYFKLSNFSYTLITIFMLLHIAGAHYTYAQVPFGFILQNWLGTGGNAYDKLVHFSFGFLLVYPLREIFMRVAKTRGVWDYYFPFDIVLAFSAIYEILEWATVQVVSPAAGLAFLGTEGDIWDAQKDMLAAGTGALLALIIIFLLNWRFNRQLISEVKDSLRIAEGERPLGEEKLRQYLKDKAKKAKR